jgi:hypothetical protein
LGPHLTDQNPRDVLARAAGKSKRQIEEAGKAIGALVQMVGPALSAKALDGEPGPSVLSLPR